MNHHIMEAYRQDIDIKNNGIRKRGRYRLSGKHH